MEFENTQVDDTVGSHEESQVLGGGDVDIVIEELNDKNENTDAQNAIDENDENENTDTQFVADENDREGNDRDRNEVENMGGGDVDIVIEELNDKNENTDVQNVTDENDTEVNEVETIMGSGDVDIVIEELSDKNENTVGQIVADGDEDGEIEVETKGIEEVENTEKEMLNENDEVQESKGKDVDNTEVIKDRENGKDIILEEKKPVEEKRFDFPKLKKTNYGNTTEKKKLQESEEDKENSGASEPNNNSIQKSISIFGAQVKKKEKGMFKVVQTEKCAACQKTVYAMEKLEMNGHIYHKNCFKCSHCSARLTAKTFSMNEGVIYCVNHFKQLFARKGNYDEGFGRQQYKKKWQGEKSEGATA